jgi:predicted RNA-binding protein with PUA-like domain
MVCPLAVLVIDPWSMLMIGVRSHEAKKIMKEKMKLGDKVRLVYEARTGFLKDRC